MRRLLITGTSGFVGGHVLFQAWDEWETFATYHTRVFSFPEVTTLSLDLENENQIRQMIEEVQPDVIIHCAAWADLEMCEHMPERAFSINAKATGILAEMCSKINCRLVYTSTDMVFDGEKGNYDELDRTNPINVYGKTKLAGEEEIQASCSDYVIARAALVYGPPLTGSNSFSERILKRVKNGEIVPLFTDQFRSPILVHNLAQALLELAKGEFKGVLHLGGADRVDRYAFGLRLAELKGFSKTLLKPVSMFENPTVAPRPRDTSLNISRACRLLRTRLLGYKEGLKEAVEKD